MTCSYVFAQDQGTQNARARAVFFALIDQEKEEERTKAMREAFEEAQIKSLSESLEIEKEWMRPVLSAKPFGHSGISYNDNILQTNNPTTDLVRNLEGGVHLKFGAEFLSSRASQTEKTPPSVLPSYIGSLSMGGLEFARSPVIEFDLGASATYYKRNSQFDRKPFSSFNSNFLPAANINYSLGRRNHKFKASYYLSPGFTMLSSLVVGGQGQVNYLSDLAEVGWESTYHRLGYNIYFYRNTASYESLNQMSNFEDEKMTLTGFLQAFPKTRFFWEADYGMSKYPRNPSDSNNANYYKGLLGVRGRLGQKTSGNLKFGYSKWDYRDGRGNNGFSADLNLGYTFSHKTSFYLQLATEPRQGNYSGEGFAKFYRMALRSSYTLNKKIKLGFGLMDYSHEKFEEGLMTDTYSTSADISYLMRRWMRLGLSVRHVQKSANLEGARFKNNVYTLTTNADF